MWICLSTKLVHSIIVENEKVFPLKFLFSFDHQTPWDNLINWFCFTVTCRLEIFDLISFQFSNNFMIWYFVAYSYLFTLVTTKSPADWLRLSFQVSFQPSFQSSFQPNLGFVNLHDSGKCKSARKNIFSRLVIHVVFGKFPT